MEFPTKLLEANRRLGSYRRREGGKSIRRRIERRFDAVLSQIVGGSPDIVREIPHARWLLDNSHLVRQALQQIETDLPSAYHCQLPTVLTRDGRKVPRIFALIDQAIDQSSLPIDLESIKHFCRRYRSASDSTKRLTLGELWVIPTVLRITLLTRLCDAAELIPKDSEAEAALDDDSRTTTIAGCITSIRTVSTFDWPDFVENTSVVEETLRKDPVGFYGQMDFSTRDHYRHSVEQISNRTTLEQWEVAESALRLAQHGVQTGAAEHRQHIGYYLIDKGRRALKDAVQYRSSAAGHVIRQLHKHRAGLYLFAIVGLAACGGIGLLLGLRADHAGPIVSIAATVIALIPLLSVSSGAVNFIVSLVVAPRQLPKLEFASGIEDEQQSIIVVPMMLSSAAEIAENLTTLERNYLGNADPRLRFALLSDFIDAAEPERPEDQPLLDQALTGIDSLNHRHAQDGVQPFLLFHRRRLWNENTRRWMGWERKRGKLEEFNELLRGATDTSYVIQHGGDLPTFSGIRYVITLDADSYMPTGAAARLIGTMAHPLNRPRFDDTTQRVVAGYTVLQPRLETNPVTGTDTRFARIFAGDVMLDLYTHAVSNVYQDLFGTAIFAGKGIYDLDAFRRGVAQKIPTNAVLSHDLLEGLLGRAGLISDIILLENYPSNYLAYLKRLHRWVRGDWQLLPWLISAKDPGTNSFRPGFIGRWQLFDNLRRSLVTPAILVLLILGWLWLPGSPVFWTLVFALFPGLLILLRITLAFRTSLWRWGTIESSLRNLIGHTGADAGRWLLALVFLPAEAYVVTDAALRTLYRVAISHRRMLEWSTAAQVARTHGNIDKAAGFWRNLWFGPATAVATFFTILALSPPALPAASVLLVLWLFSPLMAHRLARPVKQQPPIQLSETDALLMRGVARDTWRFFERFVGPETAWLPPDNVQEYPKRTIAERTSPTNIGLMLLSTLAAYDFGYLGQRQLITRLTSHLETVQGLQKHRGHLFNWYSTRDQRPLEPRYVSTVDSGNLVAALITLRQALVELPYNAHPAEPTLRGLSDELAALRRQLFKDESRYADPATAALIETFDKAQAALSNAKEPLSAAHQFKQQHCADIENAFLYALEQNPNRWSAEEIANFRENDKVFRQRIGMILTDIDLFAPWSERLSTPPALLSTPDYQDSISALCRSLDILRDANGLQERFAAATDMIMDLSAKLGTARNSDQIDDVSVWLDELQHDITSALSTMRALDKSRRALIQITTGLIESTDFGFLYDFTRNLFHVGYNTSTGEADSSYYDLLASEARIASFVAIANGDIPAKHWMHLGRPLTRIRGLRVLLSWSATAFEYLMPRLILHSPPNGLLNQSCEGAVKEQIRFGREHGIPWGVSESGYAQFDQHNQYQYFAFGIPKLGLKWDQGERLVVSSYSSLLALPYAPAETVRNLGKLISLGASGHYGLYEALDFGEAHSPRPARPRIVQSYMAHHQGMILVALGNALHQNRMPRRFHRDARIASVEYLLYEQLPQRMQTRPLERLPSPLKEQAAAPATVSQWTVDPALPELALLSNGRLSSRVSDQAGGALYWRGMAATRWDPLQEGSIGGTRIYLKDLDNDRLRCLGGKALPEDVETLFAPHAVEFRARRKEILLRMTVTVAPAADTEIRRIAITNDGPTTRHVMLSSYCEPVLAPERADRRHHTFSKLFVESQYLEDERTLLYRRRPRGLDESPMYLAHTAISQPEREIAREFEVDRGAFLGRNGDSANPTALTDSTYPFSATTRENLDPCAAIALTLDIPPRSTVQCAFLTSVAASRDDALHALQPFRSLERIDWTVEAARLQSEAELTGMRVDSDTARASFELMAKVLWPRDVPHVGHGAFDKVRHVQDALWRHGISGDRPIVTLHVDGEEDLKPAEILLKNVRYLSRKDFAIDVVFLDETKGGYTFPTNDRLRKLIETQLPAGRERDGAHAFIVPVRNLSADERSELIASSRIFIDTHDFTVGRSLVVTDPQPVVMPAFVPQPSAPLSRDPIAPVSLRDDLLWRNRYGGMLPDLSAYSLLISNECRTPAPWCNVLANPEFGTLVSEAGSMCTWWGNSSENRLTPWSNDPALDKTGEAVYVRDEETGESWSMAPRSRRDNTPYRVTHAIGESLFEHNRHGLEQRLQVFVDAEHAVKFLRIRMCNKWPRPRRLTLTFAVEWLLGNAHGYERHLLLPERDSESGALLVRNSFVRHGGEALAFICSGLPAHGVTCDGNEFFGRGRSWAEPAGLAAIGLSDRVAPNAYPCAVYQVHIDMPPDTTRDLHFVLGAADSRSAATELINKSCRPDWVDERYQVLARQWDDLLNTWNVKTPDTATDAMINRWLLYQVISSRLWGRIGFYQASGGFGFRDQLQDVLALLDTKPELAREQILLAASRQFEQGDVLHWWHEAPLRGVRSRISDDLLWLPYAVAEYVDVTDQAPILDDAAPFLQGEPLSEHELERYAEYQTGWQEASLYDHCCRAIDARILFGAHGLPLIGTGDWNDGLNRVGERGRGESVWMAWFLVVVCRRFAPLCRLKDDHDRADHYEDVANDLLQRAQETTWAGDWYLRGYFDDGTPLGAPGDAESEIDLNAQTWAVFADPNNPAARQAMRAVEEKLIDAEHRLIKLLAPPFEKTPHDPGYIRSYPPGVRENGGQYTHAAVWAPWAAVELGEKDQAMRWFEWLNPLKRARTDAEIEHYRLEPYVTSGDIYGVGALAGRGGWSWYSGSAAWLYRFAIRQMLGLQRQGDRLYLRPCLPNSWSVFLATLKHKEAKYRLQVHDPGRIRHDELFVVENGVVADVSFIALEETASHTVEIFANDAARRLWLSEHPQPDTEIAASTTDKPPVSELADDRRMKAPRNDP